MVFNRLLGYRAFCTKEDIIEFIINEQDVQQTEDIDNADDLVIFSTSRQTTWLIISNTTVYCVLDDIEKAYIKKALELTDGNKQKTAELLGVTLRSIRHRLKKLEI